MKSEIPYTELGTTKDTKYTKEKQEPRMKHGLNTEVNLSFIRVQSVA
jgi:hypothetical protein